MIRLHRPACPNEAGLRTNYKHPECKRALKGASNNKCMYCESKVTHVYFGDVEHIRPKSRYPGLEFEWTNLGYVCGVCNTTKLDKWNENTPYINPYEEDPSQHLAAIGAIVAHRNGSERGELTCRDVGLNRPELIERRQERIDAIRKTADSVYRTSDADLRAILFAELLQEGESDKEYSMSARAALVAITA